MSQVGAIGNAPGEVDDGDDGHVRAGRDLSIALDTPGVYRDVDRLKIGEGARYENGDGRVRAILDADAAGIRGGPDQDQMVQILAERAADAGIALDELLARLARRHRATRPAPMVIAVLGDAS